MSKLKIAVIFGGISSEHEISIISGTSVIENLDMIYIQFIYQTKENGINI